MFLGSPRNWRGLGHVIKFLIWSRGGRVIGVGGSNGPTADWTKYKMAAGRHLGEFPVAISLQRVTTSTSFFGSRIN